MTTDGAHAPRVTRVCISHSCPTDSWESHSWSPRNRGGLSIPRDRGSHQLGAALETQDSNKQPPYPLACSILEFTQHPHSHLHNHLLPQTSGSPCSVPERDRRGHQRGQSWGGMAGQGASQSTQQRPSREGQRWGLWGPWVEAAGITPAWWQRGQSLCMEKIIEGAGAIGVSGILEQRCHRSHDLYLPAKEMGSHRQGDCPKPPTSFWI